MIINLIGNIATGKSTFARWFTEKHSSWKHLNIASIRNHMLIRQVLNVEQLAWERLKLLAGESKNCIIESTGTIYRLADLWTPDNANRGIYTVKFTAPVKVCQERARHRKQESIEGYNLDECYGILLDKELQYVIPANLIVDTSDWSNKEEKFEEVEKYILRAKKSFEIYKTAKVIGNNQLMEE